ncbi:sensor histidine kinase [Protaetiibacter sp. SSC-01]|uniref:sensor histidine kinase n=1 Tax=Protaetiibacter sp. SSC-01 TaxID=2759943 RepID=UPI0016571F38|nr:sensor histidine kinase [Protaetiibacter sp. SSC-01]QNO37247.1 sensor histidine kinase [Protaetiibacter sp. SSC-01]
MRHTSSRVTVIALVVISVVSSVVALYFDALVLPTHPEPLETPGWSSVVTGLAMVIPGALLMWRLDWHPIAFVLLFFGTLWVLDAPASASLNYAWYFDRDAPWGPAAFWYYSRLGSILILPVQLLLILFPDGRFPRGWRRVVGIASIVCGFGMPFSFIFAPGHILAVDEPGRLAELEAFDPGILAIELPTEVWLFILRNSPNLMLLGLVLALVVAISRRFGADAELRAQLRWLVWSGAVFIGATFLYPYLPQAAVDVLLGLTIALVAGAVIIAVTRYRLYDIDRLLSWTVVYGVLIVAAITVDVLLVLFVGGVLDDRVAMLIAVIAVTIAYAPLREKLFALAARAVYGKRSDPYGLVSALGDRLARSTDTEGRIEDLARTIAEAFASPYVRVEIDRHDAEPIAAEVGTRGREITRVPIEYEGVQIGRIEMQPGRRPVVSPRDQRLLEDLVRLAAAALRNAELNRELQGIRESLVRAREESRSRLRRDLHDELGPLLAGVKLRLETSRNLMERAPERAGEVLDAAIAEQSEVIVAIRRIVHELRPPALDDLGLTRAIEQLTDRVDGAGCAVRVEADVAHPLPAAAEVAAFRIASEGLTNARRHSGAREVVVSLRSSDGTLRVEIADDGRGIDRSATPGLGLRSMRERAEELGGTFTVDSGPDRGTVLVATLPIAPATAPTPAASAPTPEPEPKPQEQLA